MQSPAKKVVLITGASSGIGEATALHLAKQGMHVVLGARRTERLQALAAGIEAEGGSAAVFALDVTKEESLKEFVDFAIARFGRVDVLIMPA
jgi:NADP-dependent 3-hydroxy acid dehydrogenase YdfG